MHINSWCRVGAVGLSFVLNWQTVKTSSRRQYRLKADNGVNIYRTVEYQYQLVVQNSIQMWITITDSITTMAYNEHNPLLWWKICVCNLFRCDTNYDIKIFKGILIGQRNILFLSNSCSSWDWKYSKYVMWYTVWSQMIPTIPNLYCDIGQYFVPSFLRLALKILEILNVIRDVRPESVDGIKHILLCNVTRYSTVQIMQQFIYFMLLFMVMFLKIYFVWLALLMAWTHVPDDIKIYHQLQKRTREMCCLYARVNLITWFLIKLYLTNKTRYVVWTSIIIICPRKLLQLYLKCNVVKITCSRHYFLELEMNNNWIMRWFHIHVLRSRNCTILIKHLKHSQPNQGHTHHTRR